MIGNAGEHANVGFRLGQNRLACPRAMADLENRHAHAGQREEIALNLLEDRYWQHCRSGGKVVHAVSGGHIVTSRKSRISLFPCWIAVRSAADGSPST